MAFPATLPLAAIGSSGSALRGVVAGVPQAAEQLFAISVVSGIANGTATITVAAPQLTAASVIIPCLGVVGGTVGALPAVQTRTAGTGFTFQGTASDTSTYFFLILG